MEENFRRAMYLSRGDPLIVRRAADQRVPARSGLGLLVILVLPAVQAKREEVFRE